MTNLEIHQLIEDIKQNHNECKDFRISILNDEEKKKEIVGYLKPITKNVLLDDEQGVISLLTKWRRMFAKFFLTQFVLSNERTERWLNQIVLPSRDRILFLVCTSDHKAIGNFGLCNVNSESAELDNLIRGEKGGDPQLIYYSELSLLKWLFLDLGVKTACLHIFSNNSKTISLHEKVGFVVTQEYKLWEQKTDEGKRYSIVEGEGQPVDFCYLEMNLDRESFISRYC